MQSSRISGCITTRSADIAAFQGLTQFLEAAAPRSADRPGCQSQSARGFNVRNGWILKEEKFDQASAFGRLVADYLSHNLLTFEFLQHLVRESLRIFRVIILVDFVSGKPALLAPPT